MTCTWGVNGTKRCAVRSAGREVRSGHRPPWTGPHVAAELGVPLKAASAALRDLADAGVHVEHGTVPARGPGRPSRLYTSAELLGLTGSNPLRG
jgi:hypothetical protein